MFIAAFIMAKKGKIQNNQLDKHNVVYYTILFGYK